jgi:hypothetical protein
MSSLMYGALTTQQEQGTKATTPVFSTYLDTLTALVPAEVLALHGVILPFTTKTVDSTTTITESGTLFWSFWGLLVLSTLFYIAPHLINRKWEPLDYARMFFPPLAFIGWTMLQRTTAFDAVWPGLAEAPRTVIALFLATILGLTASYLSIKVKAQIAAKTP